MFKAKLPVTEKVKGGTTIHYDIQTLPPVGDWVGGPNGPSKLFIRHSRDSNQVDNLGPCRAADPNIVLECWHNGKDGKTIREYLNDFDSFDTQIDLMLKQHTTQN